MFAWKVFWDVARVQDFIRQIKRIAKVINVQEKVKGICRDPKDNHVLSTASQAKADYIVSGDKDLLVLKTFNNIQIVNASMFIKIIANKIISGENYVWMLLHGKQFLCEPRHLNHRL